jgi:hypothetical protein
MSANASFVFHVITRLKSVSDSDPDNKSEASLDHTIDSTSLLMPLLRTFMCLVTWHRLSYGNAARSINGHLQLIPVK